MAQQKPVVDRKGFSLLELAVVIAILSLIMTFGFDIGSSALQGSDRVGTQEKLATIKRALEQYAHRNGYLPCPAVRDLTSTAAAFGTESRAGANCAPAGGMVQLAVAGDTIYIGMVPVRALGLPDNYASDAWRRKLTYAVSAPHTNNVNSYLIQDGVIRVLTGDRTMGNNYIVTTDFTTRAPGQGATFVVISHGPDGKGGWGMNSTTVGVACGATMNIDVENCDETNLDFYDSTYNDGAQANLFFDDYIVWGSNGLARRPASFTFTAAGCTGACEKWCAPCVNAQAGKDYLCDKHIINNNPCSAVCIWANTATALTCP